PRASNSASRSRISFSPSTPEMIHCRTFPERCRTRFPMAFSFPEPRIQICSSDNRPRQSTIRDRNNFKRSCENVRNRSPMLSGIIKPPNNQQFIGILPSDLSMCWLKHLVRVGIACGPRDDVETELGGLMASVTTFGQLIKCFGESLLILG